MSQIKSYLYRYYVSRFDKSLSDVQTAAILNDEGEIDIHCFWLDSIIKGASRDGILNSLNLPEC